MSNAKELEITARLRQRIKPETKRNIERNVAIGQRVRALLKEKGWDQRKLAEEMGKQPSEISRWLSGMHNLTMESIGKMEEVLGKPILITPETEIKQKPVLRLNKLRMIANLYVEEKRSERRSWKTMKIAKGKDLMCAI